MKTEFIKLRVSTEQKKAIVEASKGSPSMSAWIIEKILPRVFIESKTMERLKEAIENPIQHPIRVNRCMAPYCKSLETTSKLVHGSTVWLCSEHYDKG